MSEVKIHPTAIVEKGAELGNGVEVGPFCIVRENVKIGDKTILRAHVSVDGHTTIGNENTIFEYTTLGFPPQDSSYKGEPTKLIIGNKNTIREFVSIHRGTMKQDGLTKVGDGCLIMAYAHFGHDVTLGNNCIVVNSVNLAGHVTVGDRVIISGGTNISQFIRIGKGAYIGGGSGVDHDIPPYCAAYGNRVKLKGINIIGLRRLGVDKTHISEAVEFYRTMEASTLNPRSYVQNPEHLKEYAQNRVVQDIAQFISDSEVGIAPFIFDV